MARMAAAEPLRAMIEDEVRAFVEDGVVCLQSVMPPEWLDVTAATPA